MALGVRLYQLSGRSLWLDEILTAQTAHLNGPGDVIAWSQAAVNQMPLFYMFTWFVGRWGDSEAILRLPSVVTGTLMVFAVYLLGRRLFGNRIGLIAALLTAVMPYAVWYSQEARNYALFMLLTTAQMYFAITAVRRGKLLDWLGLAVFTVLDLYTHYLAIATTAAVFLLIGGVLGADLLRTFSNRARVILVAVLAVLAGAAAFIRWRSFLKAVYVDATDALTEARHSRLLAIALSIALLGALAGLAWLLRRQRLWVKLVTAAALLVLLLILVLARWAGVAGLGIGPLPLLYGTAIAGAAAALGVTIFLLLREALAATPGAVRTLDGAVGAAALVVLAYAPWLPSLRNFLSQPSQSLGVTYGGRPGFGDLVAALAALGLSGPILAAFMVGLVVVGISFFRNRAVESAVVTLWLFVPIFVLWLSVRSAILGIDPRYLSYLFPAALIVTAAGIDGVARLLERAGAGRRLDARRLGSATIVLLVAVALVQAVPALAYSYTQPKHDYRAAAEHIAARSPANSVVVAVGTYSDWTVICLDYYFRELHSPVVVVDGTRLSSDTVERLTAGGAVWGVVIFPSAEQLALVSSSTVETADFMDVTQAIHVLKASDPGLSAAGQARALLRWEMPLEPQLSASLKLLDLGTGSTGLGSNLFPGIPAGSGTGPGWSLGPGASMSGDTLRLSPTTGAPTASATVTGPVQAGSDYEVSFDWRNSELDTSQGIEAVALDAQGRGVQISPAGSGFDCGRSDSWTPSYFVLHAPPNAIAVTLILRAHGTGAAEFGAVQLRALLDQP